MRVWRRYFAVLMAVLLIAPELPAAAGEQDDMDSLELMAAGEALTESMEDTNPADSQEENEQQKAESGENLVEEVTGGEAGSEENRPMVLGGEDTIASGGTGDITWVIDADGKLTLEGTGNGNSNDLLGLENGQFML